MLYAVCRTLDDPPAAVVETGPLLTAIRLHEYVLVA
jgi:hypothetical protein